MPSRTKQRSTKKSTTPVQLFNHVAIIIDRSSSMGSLRHDVVRVFNEQVQTIQEQARKENQITRVSLTTFSDLVDPPVFFDKDAAALIPFSADNYKPSGMTALLDAVGETVMNLEALSYSKKENVSFLVVVLTDGEENQSRNYNASRLHAIMDKLQKTDRWTFAFLLPPHHGAGFSSRFGVARGNIQEWEGTTEGIRKTSQVMQNAFTGYYTARASGQTATRSFFQTDLSKVSTADLKKNLIKVNSDFKKWKVEKEEAIKPFVQSHADGHGSPYIYHVGRAFYELTKKEEVQAYKDIVIMDRKNGDMYAGPQARQLLGIPSGGTIIVEPGNHMNYSVFVKSTSVNRKLVRGTTLLYQI